jgi:WD40 repeat protein
LLWSRDSQRLASCADDGTVRIWDRASGKELMKSDCAISSNPLRGRVPPQIGLFYATNLAWSSNGDRLAVAEDNGIIRIWDTASQQVVHTLHGHNGRAGLAWNPEFDRLASAANDKIKVWDMVTGQELVTIPQRTNPSDMGATWALPVAWSTDGWRLQVSGISSNPAAITVWDATP